MVLNIALHKIQYLNFVNVYVRFVFVYMYKNHVDCLDIRVLTSMERTFTSLSL